jgi:hypothetical protein
MIAFKEPKKKAASPVKGGAVKGVVAAWKIDKAVDKKTQWVERAVNRIPRPMAGVGGY